MKSTLRNIGTHTEVSLTTSHDSILWSCKVCGGTRTDVLRHVAGRLEAATSWGDLDLAGRCLAGPVHIPDGALPALLNGEYHGDPRPIRAAVDLLLAELAGASFAEQRPVRTEMITEYGARGAQAVVTAHLIESHHGQMLNDTLGAATAARLLRQLRGDVADVLAGARPDAADGTSPDDGGATEQALPHEPYLRAVAGYLVNCGVPTESIFTDAEGDELIGVINLDPEYVSRTAWPEGVYGLGWDQRRGWALLIPATPTSRTESLEVGVYSNPNTVAFITRQLLFGEARIPVSDKWADAERTAAAVEAWAGEHQKSQDA